MRMELYLNEEEHARLLVLSDAADLSRSGYLRAVIMAEEWGNDESLDNDSRVIIVPGSMGDGAKQPEVEEPGAVISEMMEQAAEVVH